MVDLPENLMRRLNQNTQNKCTRKPSYGEMFCRSLTRRRNSMLLLFKRMAQFFRSISITRHCINTCSVQL